MKIANRVVLILAISIIAVGVASAATLDRSGTWTPKNTFTSPAPGLRSLITDGSFEQGPPPGSAWTEVSDGACEWIGNFSDPLSWGVAALDGVYDYWGGGYCDNLPNSSSVTQSVFVPLGTSALTFHYLAYRPDPDDSPADGDHGYVMINGTEVWTLPFVQATNTYPNWAGPVTVNVAAYAGTTITLSFGATSVGTATGNVRFDYVGLGTYVPPVTGACCDPLGACALVTQPSCFSPNIWHGDWTCSPNNCPAPPPITNDTCAGAIQICGDFNITGLTTGAVNDYSPTNGCASGYSETGPDIVYYIDMLAGDTFTVTMQTTGWDDGIYLITDCANMASCVAGSDLYPTGSNFSYTVPAGPGGRYYLIVDGYGTASGAFTITGTAPCHTPPVPTEVKSWGAIKASFR